MNTLSRRVFLQWLNRFFVVTGATVLLGPIIAYFYPPNLEEVPSEAVLVGPAAEMPEGASKTVRFGRYPALVIHTATGLRAYSAVCTHFACLVKWDGALGQIVCPCHEGFFSADDGAVLSGPPPTALEPLPVTVIEGQIYVGGKA